MASSSVSQDDIDNDFEKNSRRSRIRTARARAHLRLESGGDRTAASNNLGAGGVDASLPSLENVNLEQQRGTANADHLHEVHADAGSLHVLSGGGMGDALDGLAANGRSGGGNIGPAGDMGIHTGRGGHGIMHPGAGGPVNVDREIVGPNVRNASTTDRSGASDRVGVQVVGGISGIPEGHETSPKPGVLRTGKDKASVRSKLHHVNKGKYNRCQKQRFISSRIIVGTMHLSF